MVVGVAAMDDLCLRQILAEVERLRGLASVRRLALSVDFHDVFVGPRFCVR